MFYIYRFLKDMFRGHQNYSHRNGTSIPHSTKKNKDCTTFMVLKGTWKIKACGDSRTQKIAEYIFFNIKSNKTRRNWNLRNDLYWRQGIKSKTVVSLFHSTHPAQQPISRNSWNMKVFEISKSGRLSPLTIISIKLCILFKLINIWKLGLRSK